MIGGTSLSVDIAVGLCSERRFTKYLDSDEGIAGVYPNADDGSIDPASSFPFVSEHSESLFHLRIAKISEQKYAKAVWIRPMAPKVRTLPE